MDRPLLGVADVIRAAGDSFADRHRAWLRWPHIKTLNAIQRCRTAALGGHIVLPRGFVRIRYFGFLAHRRRARLLPLCRELINALQPRCTQRVPAVLGESHRSFWPCPLCGGAMVVIEHLTAAQMLLHCLPATRSP